jgi:CHAT domain-containing protein
VAFVVSRAQPTRQVELGAAAAIEAAWMRWGTAITDNSTEEAERRSATEFGRITWDKLRAHLPPGTKTVYLSPDGALTRVPFAALLGARPGTVLLEELAVATVPHGPFLLERLTAPPTTPAASGNQVALVIGGVDYGGAAPGPVQLASRGPGGVGLDRAPTRDGSKPAWRDLAGTARERQQIAVLARRLKGLEVHELAGREATTDRVLAELPRARVALLATHGFFADPSFRSAMQLDPELFASPDRSLASAGARNPLILSGLVLAGANRTGSDEAPDRGIVTAEAILGLRLDGLELAVLSACDTGLGAVAGGEGVLGLVRAFHIAGCRDVVASLWRVEDDATAALMALFFQNLWRDKLPPLEALRRAQLALYRDPRLIPKLSSGRGVDFTETPTASPSVGRPGRRARTAQWAAFSFSGLAGPNQGR